MAHTVTVLSETENGVVLEIEEDATAAALVSTDIVAALTNAGSALGSILGAEFADQAAAIAALAGLTVEAFAVEALNPATPIISANVSGAGAGNFRLETNMAKAAGTDTSKWIARFGAPYSASA
jgi:hypothetical protein